MEDKKNEITAKQFLKKYKLPITGELYLSGMCLEREIIEKMLEEYKDSCLAEGSASGWVDAKTTKPTGTWTKHEWQKHLSEDVLLYDRIMVHIGRWNREKEMWEVDEPADENWIEGVVLWRPIPPIQEGQLDKEDGRATKTPEFTCYEINVVQARMYGCTEQCKECKEKQDKEKQ